MELKDAFNEVAGRPVAPTMQQVDQDLTRARGALRKRRGLQAAGGSVFAVAAAVAAFAVATSGTAAGPGNLDAQAPSAASAQSIQLVAWTGKQPKGFTVDKVPDGWFVQARDEYSLIIAPNKVKNPGPDVDPSKDPVYDPKNATEKIAVFLQSKDEKAPTGKTTEVNGREVIMRKDPRGDVSDAKGFPSPEPERADGDYGSTVFVKQDNGIWVLVQYWGGLGFTKQQMFELAAGVHADKHAVQAVG
jgi:hypothetical protein